MTVAIPKNKFFKMISLAKSNDYIRINRVLIPNWGIFYTSSYSTESHLHFILLTFPLINRHK